MEVVVIFLSSDTMNMSPTLKALAAQTIVNNDILTDDIPLQLQEEMHTLKKVKQFQQDIKYDERKYELLQNILEQIDGDIDYYYETEDFTEGIEYFRDCEKWFKDAEYEVIGMINDKEDELVFVQNSLLSEYRNITFKMSDKENNDDLILENIKKITKNLIEQECREFETTIMEITETVPDENEKEVLIQKLYELISLTRNCAMQVLDYKLY